MYHLVYRAEPKEPAQFGSVSGSEIHNLPFSLVVSHICIGQNQENQPKLVLHGPEIAKSLYRSQPWAQT